MIANLPQQKSELSNLIPIKNENGQQLVDARNIHLYLGVKKPFSDWWIDQYTSLDLVENEDWCSLSPKSEKPKGGRPSLEIALTLDTGKHIGLASRCTKGKQIRRYFIEAEKQNNLPQLINSKADIVNLLEIASSEIKARDNKIVALSTSLSETNQFIEDTIKDTDVYPFKEATRILNNNFVIKKDNSKVNLGPNILTDYLLHAGIFLKEWKTIFVKGEEYEKAVTITSAVCPQHFSVKFKSYNDPDGYSNEYNTRPAVFVSGIKYLYKKLRKDDFTDFLKRRWGVKNVTVVYKNSNGLQFD
jgi:phage anti-repressor protein